MHSSVIVDKEVFVKMVDAFEDALSFDSDVMDFDCEEYFIKELFPEDPTELKIFVINTCGENIWDRSDLKTHFQAVRDGAWL